GVGFVADIKNRKSHAIVAQGLQILSNLEHRGAVGADPKAGDGAGLLMQLPHAYFAAEAARLGFALPEPGDYGVGFIFMPKDEASQQGIKDEVARFAAAEGQTVLGWRRVPVDSNVLGESVKLTEPDHWQVFVARGDNCDDQDAFERRLYVIRKQVSNAVVSRTDIDATRYYVVSFSSRTVVYKGLLLAEGLGRYYPDLLDERVVSALALVHQRFST